MGRRHGAIADLIDDILEVADESEVLRHEEWLFLS